MTMAITLSLLGAFVALEAVVALVVGNDRRGVTTLSRILRILCGGYLIFVAVLGWYPSISGECQNESWGAGIACCRHSSMLW